MDLLDRLLGHDSWTTRRLLELARELSDGDLDREFDIGHKSVRRTFEHLIWNIECWTDLMKSRSVRQRPEPGASMERLLERHAAADEEFRTFAREVAEGNQWDESFVDRLDDPPRGKSFGGALVHLATHGMHHRAQLLFMLRRLGVRDLPEGDALSWEQSLAGE
jgi:uncharacterized damage-inducible protein DinB